MKWHCPYCRRELEIASVEDLPFMPFCCERCKMADLGRWLTGGYSVPAEDLPEEPDPGQDGETS